MGEQNLVLVGLRVEVSMGMGSKYTSIQSVVKLLLCNIAYLAENGMIIVMNLYGAMMKHVLSELFSEENRRKEEALQEMQKDLDTLVKILTMMMILM